MSDQLEIYCGAAGGNGRRVVIAKLKGQSHRDRFDVDSEFHRRQFRETVIAKFDLPDDAHGWIETRIIAAADAEDESGGTLWQPSIIAMRDVTRLPTVWLWSQYIPAGAITVLDGDPGLGKSQLTVDLAARLSRGDCMPPTSTIPGTFTPRSTLILNAEDDPARTLRPRLDAAGADQDRIKFMRAMRTCDGTDERGVVLPLDVPVIKSAIEQHDIGLVVVDPFVAHLDSELSANDDADVRRCLGQVAGMAEQTGAAVLLVRHLNKKAGISAKYRGGGSIGITGAARAVFLLGADPADANRRVLASVKSNLGPEPPSLALTIEPVDDTSRVRWGEPTALTAADLLETPRPRGDSKLEQAKGIIGELLKDGPRGSNEVEQACLQAGVSNVTYRRARKELGVQGEKCGLTGQWLVSLPGGGDDAEY